MGEAWKTMSDQQPTRTTDVRLVLRCQLGEQDAWRELVETWNPKLIGFFNRMTNDPGKSDDLLQATWLRIVRTLTRLDQPDRFAPWAYRIARNTLTDHLRKQYRSAPTIAGEADPEQIEPDAVLESWIDRDDMSFAIQQLHPVDREVITLHYFEHLTVTEVANVCDLPVGTIKSRLIRARQQLRHLL